MGKRSMADAEVEQPGSLECDTFESYSVANAEPAPSWKHQCTASQLITEPTPVEQAQTKHQNPRGFMNLPPEILILIATRMLPSDIIALARTTKLLRSILMSRSSISIWHQSMKNVKGLPPRPKDVSEPYYIAFLYMNECSLCGSDPVVLLDTSNIMRLCQPCSDSKHSYISSSTPESRVVLELLPGPYIFREGFLRTLAEYQELVKSNDEAALAAWVSSKKAAVAKRNELSLILSTFIYEWERKLLEEREMQIRNRLMDIGWTQRDMMINDAICQMRWSMLVQRPLPQTDEGTVIKDNHKKEFTRALENELFLAAWVDAIVASSDSSDQD
ncbi:hypothetical protein RSOLAG22IIIB_08148 [Rhizoctonia solani]|uniref:F-box domain-containing protein n=1 Tax=Rhizoctonia solani TaxID=456999 RepID=A0A0K6FRM7_9AGAM|nr:hypothetical protein RSOLAG22IIIB_08148 [Rhizoctonia solani]